MNARKKPEPCQFCAVLCVPTFVTPRESVTPVGGTIYSETSLVVITRHSLCRHSKPQLPAWSQGRAQVVKCLRRRSVGCLAPGLMKLYMSAC